MSSLSLCSSNARPVWERMVLITRRHPNRSATKLRGGILVVYPSLVLWLSAILRPGGQRSRVNRSPGDEGQIWEPTRTYVRNYAHQVIEFFTLTS